MKGSNLLQVIKTMTKKELRGFSQYLLCPLFNKQKKMLEIGKHLAEKLSVTNFSLNQSHINEIEQKIQIPNDKYFRNILSDVYNLLLDYLAYLEYVRNIDFEPSMQIIALKRRKHNDLAERKRNAIINSKKYKKQHKTNSAIDYSLEQDYSLRHYQDIFVETDATLESKNKNLNAYFIRNKLRIICSMLTENKFDETNNKDCNLLLNEIIKYKEEEMYSPFFENNILATIYYNLMKILSPNIPTTVELFRSTQSLFIKNGNALKYTDVLGIYAHLRNHSIGKVNNGDKDYNELLFELLDFSVTKKLVLEYGQISFRTFNNIVTETSKQKKEDWTRKFIKDYKKHLPKGLRSNIENFAIGYLETELGKFDAAFEHFSMINSIGKDYILRINIDTCCLRIYYQKNDPAFKSGMKKFKNWVEATKKIGMPHIEPLLSFLLVLDKMFNLKQACADTIEIDDYAKKIAINKIRNDITSANKIARKVWLLEMLDKL